MSRRDSVVVSLAAERRRRGQVLPFPPDEDPAMFRRLMDDLIAAHRPASVLEVRQVEAIARSTLRLARLEALTRSHAAAAPHADHGRGADAGLRNRWQRHLATARAEVERATRQLYRARELKAELARLDGPGGRRPQPSRKAPSLI